MRHFSDWLESYIDCVAHTEAPRRMHFWTGVSTIAGALRRKVWIDMTQYKWIPNFYIILVAPPGIIAKSTTLDIGHDLLRGVPGINFGPNIVTWQALLPEFAKVEEQFEYKGERITQSALTCTVSEMGNFFDLDEKQLINLLIDLWDNKKHTDKVTKGSGEDHLINAWINLEACTTPAWLQANVSPTTVSGGLASRMIFIYADKKERLVAYVDRSLPKNYETQRALLTKDLIHISTLAGPFSITEDARKWGEQWYNQIWENYKQDEEIFGNYIARKQTHLHKLAMVISAAKRDDLIINVEDFASAGVMLEDIELDMPKVFARMGKSETAVQSERLVAFITRRGVVTYEEAFRYVHSNFPDYRDYEGVLAGIIRSGLVLSRQVGDKLCLTSP